MIQNTEILSGAPAGRHQIFAGESEDREGDPSRDPFRPPIRRSSLYVPFCMEKTDVQQVSPERLQERVTDPVQESGTNILVFGEEPNKFFSNSRPSLDGLRLSNLGPSLKKRLIWLDEEDGTDPGAAARRTTAANVASETSQAEDLQRSPQDID
ncbi:hypothetical protein AYI68_g2136 [Smittium mucronatum]|uniref:Uncharacterized protein n=1 Tax=Smittium mucronatum TaxID=133383 RepID=A0A1R0H3M4_9FUNG|nr:hypothetical protein AYI68_g2136 [Smittium mucronatum]